MRIFLKWWYRLIKKSPADMPMVSYWKFKERTDATVSYNKEGALIMRMKDEKYPFPGFPRGFLLFGKLSKLKHEIKNQLFNDSWTKLEQGMPAQEVAKEIKEKILPRLFVLAEETKYDQVPYERMIKSVKEIYRAWSKVAKSEQSKKVRDILTFVMQEDDSYRFRLQWLANYFNPNSWWLKLLGKNPIEQFEKTLVKLEQAEIIGDMKDKIKLLRRILLAGLQDKGIQEQFLAFCREVDWNKLKLSQADKFHFRGKYFRVDMELFDY